MIKIPEVLFDLSWKRYLAEKEGLENILQEFFKDESYTLERRWNVFLEYGENPHLLSTPWVTNFVGKFDFTPYDDWNVEKYERVNYVSLFKNDHFTLTDEHKKFILNEGIFNFVYNW